MKRSPPHSLPSSNPVTTQKHRRESLYQIILPFFAALLVLIGLAFFLGKATSFNTAHGAEIALIGLILPMMLFGLFFFILTIGLIVLMTKLLRTIPIYTHLVQNFMTLLSFRIRRIADGSVEPILRIQEWAAMWQHLRHRSFR